jgi:hypothetical protein
MQFKVPQFLDIEDKIFGPFTFREFVYLAGGAGLCFVLYKALGLMLAIIPMLFIAGLSAALTFYHPNGKPFIDMVEAGLKFAMQDKLFIWKRKLIKVNAKEQNNTANTQNNTISHNSHKLDGSKLRDLAWSLDVLSLKKEKKEN